LAGPGAPLDPQVYVSLWISTPALAGAAQLSTRHSDASNEGAALMLPMKSFVAIRATSRYQSVGFYRL
jgi:hypothetical protein